MCIYFKDIDDAKWSINTKRGKINGSHMTVTETGCFSGNSMVEMMLQSSL
jgi:hypothetical protein